MKKTYIVLLMLGVCNAITAQKVSVKNAIEVKEYNDLLPAVEYANASSTETTITLLKDMDVADQQLTLSNNITLDINGCELYGYASTMINITNGAAVTIKDSKGGGMIFQESDPSSTTVSVTNGTLHIASGEIKNTPYNKKQTINNLCGVLVSKDGTLTMTGGIINVDCTTTAYGVNVTGGTATISDGEVNVTCQRYGAAVNISSTKQMTINGGKLSYKSEFGEYYDIVTNVATNSLTINNGKFLNEGNLKKYCGSKYVTWKDGCYTISDKPMTTLAAMIKHTERFFNSVEEALSAAVANDTVVIMNDCAITTDATVKKGVVLLVPYNMAGTCYTKQPESTFHHMEEYVYRTLTIAEGVTLTVEGEMSVSSRLSSAEGGQFCGAGACHGPHGAVRMESGSMINVKSNAGLYCWGYIYGDGRVEINNGAVLYEALQITDWHGGRISSAINDTTFPFNQYYVQNVEVPVKFLYGARNIVGTDLFFGYSAGSANKELHTINDISYINNDNTGLFKMKPNTVIERIYDSATDRIEYIINGDMELGSIQVDIFDSNSSILAIPNNTTITQKSGGITMNNRHILSAGAKITIYPEAIMHITKKSTLYVIDKKDWDCFAALGYVLPLEYTMAHGHDNRAVRWNTLKTGNDIASYNKLTDAVLDIQGTLLCQGNIMTSTNGTNIICTKEQEAETGLGTKYYGGKIIRERVAAADTLLMCMNNTEDLKKVAMQPIVLRDTDNATFTTDSYIGTFSTFVYGNGRWHLLGDANGDRNISIADANMIKNHISGNAASSLSPAAADIDGNGKLEQDDIDLIVEKYLE